jgi:hypothetical protein
MGLDLQVELVGMATPTAQATEWTLRRSVPLFSTVVSAVELAISSFAWIPLGAYKEILEGLQLQPQTSVPTVLMEAGVTLPTRTLTLRSPCFCDSHRSREESYL